MAGGSTSAHAASAGERMGQRAARPAAASAATTAERCVICLEDCNPPLLPTTATATTAASAPTQNRRQAAGAAAAHLHLAVGAVTPHAPQASDGATGGAATACGHRACGACMQRYARAAISSRSFPVACPEYGCRGVLSTTYIASQLQDSPILLQIPTPDLGQVLERLEAEHAVPPSQRLYCPYKHCSALMNRAEVAASGPGERRPGAPLSRLGSLLLRFCCFGDGCWKQEQCGPTACSACRRTFCPTCLVPGWHQGFTCAQYQRLPAAERELVAPGDAAVIRLAADRAWRRCGACGFLIEHNGGCSIVTCVCGYAFCYRCGRRGWDCHETTCRVRGAASGVLGECVVS